MLPKYIQENVFHSFCSDILHIGLYIYIGYMGAEEILDQFVATGHRGNVLIYNTYCAIHLANVYANLQAYGWSIN